MTSITVPPNALARLLHNAALFACRDEWMPALNAVRLEFDGRATLEAVATDRYKLGLARAEVECAARRPRKWAATICLADAEHIGRLVKSRRRDDLERVTVSVNPARLTVQRSAPRAGVAGLRLSVGVIEDPSFPANWRSLFNKEPAPTELIGLNPKLVATFARVQADETRVMRVRMCGPMGGVSVEIGEDFRGLIMPVRLHRGNSGEQTGEGSTVRCRPARKSRRTA